MRETFASPFEFGQVPIASVKCKHRDDSPAVLAALYTDEEVRPKISKILKERVRPQEDHDRGRPGMDLWRVIVLSVLKQTLDCNFDRLQLSEIAP
ncbi:MAG: hypothetical protein OXU68_10710 [Bacteroidota bacterium]|nr:hypothetical protein [Bacteroidota bacterium]